MLAERATQNARDVEKAYGATGVWPLHSAILALLDLYMGIEDSGDEWGGAASTGEDREVQEEYEDEEQLATVTVVEDFNPDELIYGPTPTESSVPAPASASTRPESTTNKKRTAPAKEKVAKAKKSKRAKETKYQTQAARRADKRKQLARHTEKAERAGGKQSRKPSGKRR
jgi:ribosomal RNA-processing protein 17